MIWFVLGILIGVQLGYWAWTIHQWMQEVLQYLGAIRKARRGLPAPSLIAPVGETPSTPSIVKPKTPKQIKLEHLARLKQSENKA